MTPRTRVHAAIRGQPVDRPPFAFWRHFPKDDLDPMALAERHVEFQNQVENDLLKITPAAGFFAEMFGVRLEYRNDEEGTRDYLTTVVESPEEWRELRRPDPRSGVAARELRAVRLIRLGVPAEVPVLQTVFSPLTIAERLRGSERLLADLRERPDELRAGLQAIAETVAVFALESLRAGADGIFFATQSAGAGGPLTEEEFRAFGMSFDLEVLLALQPHAGVRMLHAHGAAPRFDLLARYPVSILNWHDRLTPPSLADGLLRFPGVVCGGIERNAFLAGSAADVRARVRDARRQTEGRRFMLGAGCVIPVDTPIELLRAARAELEAG
jgi:uroporphyrinogen decarboxylase